MRKHIFGTTNFITQQKLVDDVTKTSIQTNKDIIKWNLPLFFYCYQRDWKGKPWKCTFWLHHKGSDEAIKEINKYLVGL